MSIGTTIKRLRRDRNITQEQLAEYLGISTGAISQWECDRTAPDITQLPLLANIFDVSADELLEIGGKKKEDRTASLVCGHICLDVDARNAYNDGKLTDLTAKEYDLIELLMRNPNRVYSRETLLDTIWGYEYTSDIRTVDVHIRRLREKLEVDAAEPAHIMTKWGVGYYFKE